MFSRAFLKFPAHLAGRMVSSLCKRYMFSRAFHCRRFSIVCHWWHVFPRFPLATRFLAFTIGDMFSRAFHSFSCVCHWWHVFPPFPPVHVLASTCRQVLRMGYSEIYFRTRETERRTCNGPCTILNVNLNVNYWLVYSTWHIMSNKWNSKAQTCSKTSSVADGSRRNIYLV